MIEISLCWGWGGDFEGFVLIRRGFCCSLIYMVGSVYFLFFSFLINFGNVCGIIRNVGWGKIFG